MHPQKKTFVIAISICILGQHFLLAQTPDCSVHWDPQLQISYDSVYYSTPRIAVSGDTVHATWFGTDFLGTVASDGVQYSRSENRGQTFSIPATIASFDTALSPAYISSSGSFVYLAFEAASGTFSGMMVFRSTDAGITWLPPQRLKPRCLPLLIESIDNIVYVHDYNRLTKKNEFLRSTDNGATWDTLNADMPELASIFVTKTEIHGVSSLGAGIRDIVYLKSQDAGRSWRYMEFLSNSYDFTTSLFPKIAGNGKRDLYVAWNDTGVIYMRHSANSGLSWLPAVELSFDDGSVLPDIAASHEFVTVVWDNDFGGTSTLHLRQSNDYGFSFCPLDHPSTDSGTGGPSIKVVGNDLHVVWSKPDGVTGTIGYRHGTLIDNPNVQDRPPSRYALAQNYPNPFDKTTRIRFDLPQTEHVRLTVFDVLGKEVARLVDDERAPGRYEIVYNVSSIASGLYIYELSAGGFTERKKLLILH